MTKKTDDLVRYLQTVGDGDDRLLSESKKWFWQKLLICFWGFLISIGLILWLDISIASSWGFAILLFPIYYLVMNISELCQNAVITTIKLQELIRLSASQLDLEIDREKGGQK